MFAVGFECVEHMTKKVQNDLVLRQKLTSYIREDIGYVPQCAVKYHDTFLKSSKKQKIFEDC